MTKSSFQTSLRSHTCGELSPTHEGQEVTLCGWVDRRRDQGGIQFVDLRDRFGRTQIVLDRKEAGEAFQRAERLHLEDVICVTGRVDERDPATFNPALGETGKIEVRARTLDVLSDAMTPLPFEVSTASEKDEEVNLELRLTHRYLDLRRPSLQERLIFRHRINHAIRAYMDRRGFVDVETPMLTRSTPEGARDYVVPSRVHKHAFYALPQSPQLFKQLLMVAGFDRYYQIVRCFRDEDLRADRQPEFTQLDIEMSYISEDDLFREVEGLMSEVLDAVGKGPVKTPFPRLTYADAMLRYGCDKPDLRFDWEIRDISDLARDTSFKVFHAALEKPGGCVRALRVPGGARLSRKEVDGLEPIWREAGAAGLAWYKWSDEGRAGTVAKFFDGGLQDALDSTLALAQGDLVLFVADTEAVAAAALCALRLELGRKLGAIREGLYQFAWIVDWPLFEKGPAGEIRPAHHPFTSPRPSDLPHLEERPFEALSRAYDLVMNGLELGSGSIRIHRRDVQQRIFRLLGIGEDEARAKFGFLLRALEMGAPPHGGVAFGLDRFTRLLAGCDNIREVIAFPKTLAATCPMSDAPSVISAAQLQELSIKLA